MLFIAVMAVIAASAVAPAHAQVEKRMSVSVPFDFALGKATLRNGQYKVEELPTGVVAFTNLDGFARQFAMTSAGGQANGHNGEPVSRLHTLRQRYVFEQRCFFRNRQLRVAKDESREGTHREAGFGQPGGDGDSAGAVVGR